MNNNKISKITSRLVTNNNNKNFNKKLMIMNNNLCLQIIYNKTNKPKITNNNKKIKNNSKVKIHNNYNHHHMSKISKMIYWDKIKINYKIIMLNNKINIIINKWRTLIMLKIKIITKSNLYYKT